MIVILNFLSVIKHIIFDLDDTLLDTTRQLLPLVSDPQALLTAVLQKLDLLPGANEVLDYLSSRYVLSLISQGNPEFQKKKIASCAIARFFSSISIADSGKGESKAYYFRELKARLGLPGENFLSIGNRRSTDIREAKICQMQTCLFKYGEHSAEQILVPQDIADFEVTSHRELIAKCSL